MAVYKLDYYNYNYYY